MTRAGRQLKLKIYACERSKSVKNFTNKKKKKQQSWQLEANEQEGSLTTCKPPSWREITDWRARARAAPDVAAQTQTNCQLTVWLLQLPKLDDESFAVSRHRGQESEQAREQESERAANQAAAAAAAAAANEARYCILSYYILASPLRLATNLLLLLLLLLAEQLVLIGH